MSRKKFIEAQGATCNNWASSWSFVNHKEMFVIFGAWDANVKGDAELILSDKWQVSRGRKQAGYTQAREHIRLVEEEGYQLKTFSMQFSDEKMDENGNGPAKIKGFIKIINPRELNKVGGRWFAVPTVNEEKVARICWNSEWWKKPSGITGKSKNKDAYESNYGYGHEEWLLDTTKIIDGYHYAFIQAIGSNRNAYIGKIFNISFYSINGDSKRRWWIGAIKNVQIVSEVESIKVLKIYKEVGWYDEMISQLKHVDADIVAFKKFTTPGTFAALKYKVEDLELLDEPLEFTANDPAVLSDYYNLKNKVAVPALKVTSQFEFVAGHNSKKRKSTSSYQEHTCEIDLIHNQLQEALFEQLSNKFGKDNVGTERPTGSGTRIDAVVKHNDKYSFYEIKTSQSVRQCVRDAIGQLLEYAHFARNVPINEFVIVTPHKVTQECATYLTAIRKIYDMPIVYQQFDLTKMRLLTPS